jgi:hypothetical protein
MALQRQSDDGDGADEWVTVREFVNDDSGFEYPKYEVTTVEDHDQEGVEDELVLLREVSPVSGHERVYQFPPSVVEAAAERLADRSE